MIHPNGRAWEEILNLEVHYSPLINTWTAKPYLPNWHYYKKNCPTNQMNFKTKFTLSFKSYKRAGFAVLPAII
jgi:hypothetical protein